MSKYFAVLHVFLELHAAFALPQKHCDSSEFNSDELSVKYDPYHGILILNWSIDDQIQAIMRARMGNRTVPSCEEIGKVFDKKIPEALAWTRETMVSRLGPLVNDNESSCPYFPFIIAQNPQNTTIDCLFNDLGDARLVWTSSETQPTQCVSLVNMATIRRICTSVTAFAERIADSFNINKALLAAEHNDHIRSVLATRRQYLTDTSDTDSD